MKQLLISLIALIFSVQIFAAAEIGEDPYKKIEHIKLKNGMQVFLAPSDEATTTSLRLEVGVGWDIEKSGEYGISHLLEHVLFRDKSLKDEMTYLQLIREAGGEANGSTSSRVTSYFGSIPAKKGTWLLESFGKMILVPSILPEFVQKEKGTVELEIGRPGPISETLGFNPMDYLYPSYLREPGFWKSEFGIKGNEDRFTRTEEQLSNRKLEPAQLEKHYADWYYPANMKLFVAGKYDRAQMMAEIEKTWGSLPAKEGKKMPAPETPNPVERPFVRRTLWDGNPYVYLGAKAWNMSFKDTEIAQLYMEFLTHRLMKEIRNIKGQTYSANASVYFNRGYGYGAIQFQTPKEHLLENIDIAKDYIQKEAREGQITEAQMKEAITLYLSQYQLMGRDAEKMMSLASHYDSQLEEYGSFVSPFQVLQNMKLDEYKSSLKATFNENHAYEMVYSPYLFFTFDIYVLYFLTAVVSFIGLRKFFTKPFAHDRLQWIRKIQYPPVKMMEALGLVAVYVGVIHFQMLLTRFATQSQFIQSHLFLSNYLSSVVWMFGTILIACGVYALMPRKMMVVDGKLMIKSVTYYSKLIPLEQISKVESFRGIAHPFAFKLWFKQVGFRNFFVTPKFWQKGLLIHLKNGKAYYYSVNQADKAALELTQILVKQQQQESISIAA
ncbi:insulinase family protein [Bdellovibrio sp. SKB1291214]|uniref:M16 family metallopeptidase n=1 Tax=Bdellovibrio sp. SKB1291214 TaxID=1732569 RepID=UPI000B5161BD|nr:pitrilysin family protein [Bdellovibrio sp. SKB1291214]UYL09437.1 insulinase family protein [Bdellovibrio sp. SKB1291214]